MSSNYEIIQEFQDATKAEYDTFAFASGYLGSVVVDLLYYVPKAKRHEVLQELKARAEVARANASANQLSDMVQ